MSSSSSKTFLCVAPSLQRSEHLFVLGSSPALGSWDETKAVPMALLDAKTCLWSSGPVAFLDDETNANAANSYKYISKIGQVLERWEALPPPHRTTPPSSVSSSPDVFGFLPAGHPKWVSSSSSSSSSSSPPSSSYLDSGFCSPNAASSPDHLRLTLGAYNRDDSLLTLATAAAAAAAAGQDEALYVSVRCSWGGYARALSSDSSSASAAVTSDKHLLPNRGQWLSFDLPAVDVSKAPPDAFVILEIFSSRSAAAARTAAAAQDPPSSSDEFIVPLCSAVAPLSSFYNVDRRRGRSPQTRGQQRLALMTTLTSSASGVAVPLGSIVVEHLLVRPFSHAANNVGDKNFRLLRAGCVKGETLDVGHRGAGRSFRFDLGWNQVMASVRENTIASFEYAGVQGKAEYVELDVMLTKDRVPVVFHDFEIGVRGRKLNAKATRGGECHALAMFVSQMTLNEFESLGMTGHDTMEFKEDEKSMAGHRAAGAASATAPLDRHASEDTRVLKGDEKKPEHKGTDAEATSPYFPPDDGLHTLPLKYPTLAELLDNLPPWLGLNIEIKYPISEESEWLSFHPQYEINAYADDILRVLFDKGRDRRLYFSCFSPDFCAALQLKQARYPVLFLCGDDPDSMSDVRCQSLEAAVRFASECNLAGIVPNSGVMFEDKKAGKRNVKAASEADMRGEDCVKMARDKNLLFITWGDTNSHSHLVQLQKKWGVDAVICDNIQNLVDKDKAMNRFQKKQK